MSDWLDDQGRYDPLLQKMLSAWSGDPETGMAVNRRLRDAIMEFAGSRSPYYRRAWRQAGERFDRLPVLTKSLIRERFDELFAEGIPEWRRVRRATSGSTGEPLVFFRDTSQGPLENLSARRFLMWLHDIPPGARMVWITTDPRPRTGPGPPAGVRPGLFRRRPDEGFHGVTTVGLTPRILQRELRMAGTWGPTRTPRRTDRRLHENLGPVAEPLAYRMRPRSFDEVVGQRHLLGPGKPLTALAESGQLPSLILWGPAGSGKTTLAYLLAEATGGEMVRLSAVSSGVADARKVMDRARGSMLQTVLFVDEVHRWSKAQQDVLLPSVEDGTITLLGATTENPYFSLVSPLLSRCLLLRLEALSAEDLKELLDRAVEDADRGVAAQGVDVDPDAIPYLAEAAAGDARAALSGLEAAVAAARSAGRDRVDRLLAEDVVQRTVVYDRDQHYDVISAFIKSLRGSDPDAALFWLARMLEAGEDPRFIARRMVILASEDIGPADPQALRVAVDAAQAVEFVGLPEAQLNLAQAAIHLANAPKSNEVVKALARAKEDAALGDAVPKHLRDAHYPAARGLGHGEGYVYPHGDPEGAAGQSYRPPRFQGRRYVGGEGTGGSGEGSKERESGAEESGE